MSKKSKSEATSTVVAKINEINIVVVENGEKRVALKPICEALGINYESQYTKIYNDDILSSTIALSTMVGADGKERDMVTIPIKYVFGWLFTINPKNVNPAAKETVIKYKMLCYDALYDYFTGYAEFVEVRQAAIEVQLEKVKDARKNYRDANSNMRDAEKEMDRIRQISFDEYKADKAQFTIEFPNEEGGEK